jgi:hypothetical protein
MRFALLRASLWRNEESFMRLYGTAESRALTLLWALDAVWRRRRPKVTHLRPQARSNLFVLANLLHTSIIKIIGPDTRSLKATAF